MRDFGHAGGEYVGNGQADGEAEETLDMDEEVHDDNGLDEDGQEEEEEDGSNHSQALHFFYIVKQPN